MSGNIKISKICEFCNSFFIARTTVTKYCSQKCASKSYKERSRKDKIEKVNNLTALSFTHKIEEVKSKSFLSINEACILVGISRSTINRLLKGGDIPFSKLGKRVIIHRSDIEEMLTQAKGNIIEVKKDTVKFEYYNVEDIQNIYSIKYSRLNEIVKKYSIPKIVKAGKVMFSKSHIDKYFNKKRKDVSHITQWYTVKEIQDKYSMSRDQVYNRIHDYQIPKMREGKFVKISKIDFDSLFNDI